MRKIIEKKNLRSSIIKLLMLVMLMSTTIFADSRSNTVIFIDEQEQTISNEMGQPFLDAQGRAQVPLRFVSEKLGHKVEWEPKKQEVSIDNKTVIIAIGDKNIKVNGESVVMDTAPVMVNGRTYVPVRFIAEALGHTVDYKSISGRNCILITKSGNVVTPVDENEEGEVNPEYKPEDAPTYQKDPSEWGYDDETKHWVKWSVIGSNLDNMTVREPGTSFVDDLGYLNSLVGRYGYGFAGDGQLTIGGKDAHLDTPRGSDSTSVAIGHVPGKEPRKVTIRGWVTQDNTKPSESQMVQNNLSIEAIKYFSDTIEDGHAIVAYVDKYMNKKEYPPLDQNMIFGSTKVRFEKKAAGWGFHIVFND